MMDNKITGERLNNHLEYDWFKYIIFIIVSIFLWFLVYSMLDKIKDHQRIDFFVTVSVSGQKTLEFEADFIEYLKNLDDDSIKEVNFNYNDFNDASSIFPIISTSYNTHDLVIAQEEAFRYLAVTGRLVGLDCAYDFKKGNQNIRGNVFEGFTVTSGNKTSVIEPYLNEDDFSSYYVLDEDQIQQAQEEFPDMQIPDEFVNIRFGIELNPLAPNLFFPYDEENRTKYYIGVISSNLSKSAGGGNKGVFNAQSQDIYNKQAWDAINYLKQNAAKYSM
jgi:hypothetical protein